MQSIKILYIKYHFLEQFNLIFATSRLLIRFIFIIIFSFSAIEKGKNLSILCTNSFLLSNVVIVKLLTFSVSQLFTITLMSILFFLLFLDSDGKMKLISAVSSPSNIYASESFASSETPILSDTYRILLKPLCTLISSFVKMYARHLILND